MVIRQALVAGAGPPAPARRAGSAPAARDVALLARGTRSVAGAGSEDLQGVLERGRRVFTAVVVVLQLLVVAAALAAAALAPGGGSPSVVVAAAVATTWLLLAAVHLVRGLPVALLVLVGLVCAAALPPLVAAGTPVEAQGVLRVLPTTASAVLWLLAGTTGRVGTVLVRAVGTGAAALAVVSASAALVGLGRLDVVGPLVTALLAVASLLVADRCATRAERSLAAQRAAAVDLLVARDLAAARRRLDGRLHDVVLGALAAMVTADAARAPAVRELAAEALAVLVAAGPDAALARRVPAASTAGGAMAAPAVGAPAAGAVVAGAERLEAGLQHLVERAAGAGLVVQLRREDAAPAGAPATGARAAEGDPAVAEAAAGAGPDPEVVEALLGAVGECLRNVERHARTASALLVWSAGPEGARALVVDAGAGFDPTAVPPGSLGLSRSVRSRLEDVGGSAHVRSRPGRGTVVHMGVPSHRAGSRCGAPAASADRPGTAR